MYAQFVKGRKFAQAQKFGVEICLIGARGRLLHIDAKRGNLYIRNTFSYRGKIQGWPLTDAPNLCSIF